MGDPRARSRPAAPARDPRGGPRGRGPSARRGRRRGRRRRRSRRASGKSRATSSISPRSSETWVCQYAPVRRGERRGLAQHVGRARDREPRRDRVAEPAVVAAVPARDEVGRLAQAALEDRRRVDRLVVGAADPSSPCRRSPGSRAPRLPGTWHPGWPRRPRRRRARSSCPAAANARKASGREALGASASSKPRSSGKM